MVRPGISFDDGDDGLEAQPTRPVSERRSTNLMQRSSSLGTFPSEVFMEDSDNASLITEGTWLRISSSRLSQSHSCTDLTAETPFRWETEDPSSDHVVLHIQQFDAGNDTSQGDEIGQGVENSMEQSPQHVPLHPAERFDDEAPSTPPPPLGSTTTTTNNTPTTTRPSTTAFLVEASLVPPKTGKKHAQNHNAPPLSDDAMFWDSLSLVEAKPMTSSIPLLLRHRRFQCGVLVCCILFTAVILGAVYAATGFFEFGFADKDDSSSSSSKNPSPSPPADTTATLIPTLAGDPELYYFQQALLPSYTQDALQNPESPQTLALEWLLTNENLETLSDARRRQRFVLATLFYSTRGQRWWLQKDGWLDPAVHECEWYSSAKSSVPTEPQTTTSSTTSTTSTICVDDEYRILDLTGNELRGTIPAEIALLTGLTSLVLDTNFVSGMIPSLVGALTNLQTFSVLDNFLSGTLPSALGEMTQLQVLNLSNNLLVQTLPTTVGRLTNLKQLLFGDNEFMASSLPTELGLLATLETLGCHGNSHTGTIPSEFSSLSALEHVRFDSNFLEGPLPEMRSWTNLESLNVGHNRLTGNLMAKGLESLTNLKYIDIYANDFTGTLAGLGQLTNAETLMLENNGFDGILPTEIGNLSKLTLFWAYGNELTGDLPSEIGKLAALTSLDMSYNSLKGIMPTEIGLLTKLETLFLEENDFEGTVPTSFSSLRELTALGLHKNSLAGEVPLAVCGLTTTAVLNREHFTIDCNEIACDCCTCESDTGFNW